MKSLLFIIFLPISLIGQDRLSGKIKDNDSKNVLVNVSVLIKKIRKSVETDSTGNFEIKNIPNGKYVVEFSHVGYKDLEKEVTVPLNDTSLGDLFLEPDVELLQGVTVSTTRSNRSISSTPSRVEIISDEEIHEEGEMRPGDIKMLLSESTGIQTQQTSATSGNASLRLQGLDGRYTQILKDGFPIYSGAASGLGLLQTPPLDLRQVEIIKGSSSTLYGGGAIAGLINLISKVPQAKRELSFHVNGTTAKGLDINSFYSQQFDEMGITVFAARNSNGAYAPGNAIFTAIPQFERYTLNPKIFLHPGRKTKITAGINSAFEHRLGGDLLYIQGKGDNTHQYFEDNKTKRISSTFSLDHILNEENSLLLKNSVSYYNRIIHSKNYAFNGTQNSTFTEGSFLRKTAATDWVGGFNIETDVFHQLPNSTGLHPDYHQWNTGVFGQNTWNTAAWLTIETGMRADYVEHYGFILLPRISALFKFSDKLSSRLGGGFGYKTPSIFTEETERLLYKNILPVNSSENELERSYGVNGDLNYKTVVEKLHININQFFFYTYLSHPLQLFSTSNNQYQLRNIGGNINSRGMESNLKFSYNETSIYIGYTFTDAKVNDKGSIFQQPLTPRHRLNAALVYEIENKWKVGSELYYFSSQQLTNGETGRGYWLSGLVVERLLHEVSVYINFENFGDIRQSRFGSIYEGPISDPVFKDIYAPLDGFVANAGMKIKL